MRENMLPGSAGCEHDPVEPECQEAAAMQDLPFSV